MQPGTSPRVIEVFADVRCPFAHVGLRRIVSEREARGVSVPLWVRAWPLELVNAAPLDPVLIAEEIDALRSQVARELFAGFDVATFSATSLPAMALTAGAYAIRPEVGERVALALRWALFEEGRDISTPAVLLDIAESAGMGLPHNCEQDRVRDDLAEGRDRGVIGSPHFFIGDADYFCPTLDITHSDGRLLVARDRTTFLEMIDKAFAVRRT
ncbi:MAG TPA: DsbA family protein [Acidimicrobiales bacterium]|nr:DsbA family protein [Acidimicrobiales bacterium]